MEESFLDVVTDNALNERFDKIILQNEKYNQLQEKIEGLSGEYDSLALQDEQKLVINSLSLRIRKSEHALRMLHTVKGLRTALICLKRFTTNKRICYNKQIRI